MEFRRLACLAVLTLAATSGRVEARDILENVSAAAPAEIDASVIDPESVPVGQLILPVAVDDEHLDLATALRQAELVFDGVVVKATTRRLEGARILVTEYRFEVFEWFRGGSDDLKVTLIAGGGEHEDGTGMSMSGALKLEPQRRYLIVATDRTEATLLPIRRALQLASDGSFAADEAGRIVTGISADGLAVRRSSEVVSLDYLKQPPSDPTSTDPGPPTGPGLVPQPADDPLPAAELAVTDLFDGIAAILGTERQATRPIDSSLLLDPLAVGRYLWCGRINDAWNYFTFLPDDNHWAYWNDCAGNWNTIVADNPSGPDWLVGYWTSSGLPIRDRNPVAGDGNNHSGVVSAAQLSSGGYGVDWSGANGWNFTWYEGGNVCYRIVEVDTFVNPAIADDPVQFRKSMTHEMGHALGQSTNGAGGHEDRVFAIMYAGTWQQPPNYISTWYGRKDDMAGVRSFLRESNNHYPGTWVFESWTDMATWSMSHDNPGNPGNLIMTDLSTYSGRRGDTVTVRHLQVENRGTVAATDVYIRFYLSSNPTISEYDYEAGSAYWITFGPEGAWQNGSWDITVPSGIPAGNYYIGWVITQNEGELSSANNTTNMRATAGSGFAERTFTVIGNPDLHVPTFSIGASSIVQGSSIGMSAIVRNSGDAPSPSSTLRYYLSTNDIISIYDTQVASDYVAALTSGGTSSESASAAPSLPGTYWLGTCVDTVAFETPTDNQCSTGRPVDVLPALIFSDGFNGGNTSLWSFTLP